MFFLNKNKFAQVNLIIVVLVLGISIFSVFYLNNWFLTYKSNLEVSMQENNFKSDFMISKIDSERIYFKNNYADGIEVKNIKIGELECSFENNTLLNVGEESVVINNCIENETNNLKIYEVIVVTNLGVYHTNQIIRKDLFTFDVVFKSGLCNLGYTGLFSLTDIDNAHAGVYGTTTYNVCAKFGVLILKNINPSNFVNLFYLLNDSNSHVWLNKSDVIIPQNEENWINISFSINSNDYGINYTISSLNLSNLGFKCIASIDIDNIYGAHIGNCLSSSYTDKLWLKIQ